MTRRVGANRARPDTVPAATRRAFLAAGVLAAMPGCQSGTTPHLGHSSTTEAGTDASLDAAGGDGQYDSSDGLPALEDAPDETGPENGGTPAAQFASSIDVGTVTCGQSGGQTFAVNNVGTGTLVVNAATSGLGFSVSPPSLTIAPGTSASFAITVNVPASSAAGSALTGSLNLFTNDPAQASVIVPTSVTPSGATIAFASGSPSSAAFPPTESGSSATPITLSLVNTGNAPAMVSIGAPSDAQFTLSGSGSAGASTMDPAATLTATAGYTPSFTSSSGSSSTATASVTVIGDLCGTSISAVAFTGTIGHGRLTRWPSTLDFGPAECGGSAPDYQYVVLANAGTTNATITSAVITGSGYTTNATGLVIPAGLTADFVVFPPSVPAHAALDPVVATLAIFSDADSSEHDIALTEQPHGSQCAVSSDSGAGGDP